MIEKKESEIVQRNVRQGFLQATTVLTFFIFALMGLYYLGGGITGFTFFEQTTQQNFSNGIYENTIHNGTGIILLGNNLTGNYTSEIIDAGNISVWNNLSWIESNSVPSNSFLNSAIHEGTNRTKVFVKDNDFYNADMKDSNKRFYLNFSKELVNGTILKMFAKKDKGNTVGIYNFDDINGDILLGSFTVSFSSGEWYNVSLTNISSPTKAIWLGEGTGSGTDPKEEFDYIFAETNQETNLKFQIRSSNNLSWGNWTGPDGTNSSYYTNSSFESLNVPNNRYLQYLAHFSTNTFGVSPVLMNISINYDLFVSSVAPSVTLDYPSFASTYNSTTNLPLNFTITNSSELDSCWYSLDKSVTNETIPCVDTTFNVSEGLNNLIFYVNESLNGLIGQDNLTFFVNLGKPTIHLKNPKQNKYSNSAQINLTYIPSSSLISSCNLYGDFNGTYSLNQTNNVITQNQENIFSVNLSEGTYSWAISCLEDVEESFTGNRTFIIDLTSPTVNVSNPNGSFEGGEDIPIEFSVIDESPVEICSYTLTKSETGEVVEIENITGCENTTISVAVASSYNLELFGDDAAGNTGSDTASFSFSSGGGGGGSSSTTGNVVNGLIGVANLTLSSLEDLNLGRGESEFVELEVLNSGQKFLNGCKLSSSGDIGDWISNEEVFDLSSGQKVKFIFSINTPSNIDAGKYSGTLSVGCEEKSESSVLNVEISVGNFEATILSSERINNVLKLTYTLENFEEKEKEFTIIYSLVNSKGNEVLTDEEVVFVGSSGKELFVKELNLPKNSFGEFTVELEISDAKHTSKYHQKVILSKSGLTGLAISDGNLKTLSWIGAVILMLLGIGFVVRFLRKRNREKLKDSREYIKIDLRD